MKITANGMYRLNQKHSMSKSVVYIAGNPGGATLTLKVFDIPLVDGVMTPNVQYEVHHGVGVNLMAEISGGSGINAEIHCVGIH